MEDVRNKITPFLMFTGQAEEAMNFYMSLFNDSKIKSISRYSKEGPGLEGTVELATFLLKGQEFMCIDSYIEHDFSFTPSISMYITCDSVDEIKNYYETLSQNGQVYMPLSSYPFSEQFAWVEDQFGVSWQLNLD